MFANGNQSKYSYVNPRQTSNEMETRGTPSCVNTTSVVTLEANSLGPIHGKVYPQKLTQEFVRILPTGKPMTALPGLSFSSLLLRASIVKLMLWQPTLATSSELYK